MNSAEQVLKDENIFIGEEIIGGIPCQIGYIKKFKWSWFATQLNLFVIIGQTEKAVDRQMIETFSKNCFDYSIKNNRGWFRGLQSGVGSMAILQAAKFDEGAIDFCEKLSKSHWSAFEIPVLYDTSARKLIRYKKNPIWGMIYFPFFTKTIDHIASRF